MILFQPKFRSKKAKTLLLMVIFGFMLLPFVHAQRGVTNNGARIIVNTGAVINITGAATEANYTNKTYSTYHGRIDLDGKIKLQGSWTNSATSGNVLINTDTDGEVIFNGTTTQSILGSYISSFEKLTLNNSTGLSLSRHINVYGALTLTSGNIVLNAYNLSIQATGSTSGTFDATKMIVADSTGTLRKYFTSATNFTFPIGDNNGTLEYSPISFTLNSATGYSSAYVSAKVTDNKHPNNGSIAEYLTRYWTLNSSGFTSPNYNATFNYLDADIYGTESKIYSARYVGATRYLYSKVDSVSNLVSVTGLSTFYDFTGVDGTRPTVTISTTASNPTNLNPIPVTITFSEQVTGFTRSDIDTTNCTLSALNTSDNKVFTLNVYPTGTDVSINIAAAKCSDLAGNTNTAAASPLSRTYDGASPTVTLTSSVLSYTNAAFSVTFTFSESVTGFVAGDIATTNASVSGFSGSGTTYSATITPTLNGPVTVKVNAGVASDPAGNPNEDSNTISTIFDDVEPTPTLSSTATNPTNQKPFVVKIAFNEKINSGSISLSDITVNNATKDNLTMINTDSVWTVNVYPSSDAAVTVNLAAGQVADYAGNTNNASNTYSTTYDGTKPDVTIISTETDPTNNTPFQVTIEFTEVVSGFVVGDITVVNGTADNLSTVVTNKKWTANINPGGNGLVTVDIAGGVASDNAGNTNNAASQYSITFDDQEPAATVFTPADEESAVSVNANLEIVFNELVNLETDGFIYIKETTGDATFLTVDLSSSPPITGTGTTTITIDPGILGDFKEYYVLIDDTVFTDNAGNYFVGISDKAVWNFKTVDTNVPSIESVSPVDNSVDIAIDANLQIDFTENVTAVAGKYIYIMNANGPAQHQKIEATDITYVTIVNDLVTINPATNFTGENNYYVTIDAGAFEDADNNPFAGISSATYWNFKTEDVTDPTVSTYSPVDNATDIVVSSNLQLTFSENVDKGASGSIIIKRASDNSTYETIDVVTTGPVAVSNNVVTINPSTDFETETEYYVLIDAGAFVDVSSNANPFAGISGIGDWSFTSEDIAAPTVGITSFEPDPTNNAFSVTITFSEEVDNFKIDDISAENANLSNFVTTIDSTVFTVTVSPVNNGTVTVEVIEAVCQDLAGNNNSASNTFTIEYDNTQPTVSISTLETSPTNNGLFDITITFSEEVSVFEVGEISVDNCIASDFATTDNIVYTAKVAPTSDGTVTLNVNAGVAADAAGNANLAATQLSLVYDGTAPTLTITTEEPNPTNNQTFTAIFTFSERVSGFALDSIDVFNGSKANCITTDSVIFTAEITALAGGNVTVRCVAGVAVDLAGNASTAATDLVNEYDNIVPTVLSITSTASDPTLNSPIPITITFSEEVTGFDLSDLVVGNGSPSNLTPVNQNVFNAEISPYAVGTVTVDINADAVCDLANNPNTAATQFTIEYQGVNTTVDLDYSGSNPTNTSPIEFTITFSESVNGFTSDDFSTVNGSVSNLLTTDNIVFNALFVPLASGLVEISVPANVATNPMGNGNSKSDTLKITFDNTPPTVEIASVQSSPTNSNSIPITITFSETVTGFENTDITFTNGSISGWSMVGNVYSTTLIPDAPGIVTVSVAAGVANDLVGNANTASDLFSIVYDIASPTVTITSSQPDTIYETVFDITITFSEEVTGFDLGEIIVFNGNPSNLVTTNGIVYTADITATDVGAVTVDIAAGIAYDLAGNPNTIATQFSLVYGGPKPTVTISAATSSPTNVSPITIDINFSESVTGLELADFVITGGTLDILLGSDADYTVQLTPLGDGQVSVNLPADKVENSFNNGNNASNVFEITYDGTAPSVAISSTVSGYTKITPIPLTITFSEQVSLFAQTDIVIVNGTPSALITTDSILFTLNITPADTGEVTVNIAADIANDLAGNNNNAATEFSIVYDNISPTVVIESTETSPTSNLTIPVTITFSELVTGFDLPDIVIGNGSAENLVQNGAVYSFTLVPDGDGTCTVDVLAGAAHDAAGNNNTATAQFSIVSENGPPSVAISYNGPNPTNSTSIPVDIVFSEPVIGFSDTDVILTNATITGSMTQSVNTYSISLAPISEGIITIEVPANIANDLFGNSNTASEKDSIRYDATTPNVVIETAVTSPTNISPISLTIRFSETVIGFDLSDITLNNGDITDLTGSDSLYTATLQPFDGLVTVSIAANAITDIAGNGNTVSNTISITFDGTNPQVEIASTVSGLTNLSSIPLTITFSENVSDFAIDSIDVVNGTLSDFTGTDNVYTVTLTPTADGFVTVNIAANKAIDAVGNGNDPATEFSVTFDTTPPTIAIGSTQASPTNSIAINVTLEFNESITGFDITDIDVTNGELSNLTNIDNVYSVILTPTNTGTSTIGVAADKLTDLAGNNNLASDVFSIVYDGTAPEVVITSTAGTIITTANFTVDITFTEAVTDFVTTDVVVTNGTVTGITTTDNIVFTASITAASQGVVTINVPAGAANDLAGNPNTAASEFSITYNPSTGIDDVKQYQVEIYPIQGAIVVEIMNPGNIRFEKGQIEIFNVVGLPIVELPIENFNRFIVPINESSAVYVVKLTIDEKIHMKKCLLINKIKPKIALRQNTF